MNKLIILLLMVAGLYSCQKKSDAEPDASQAVLTITSPVAGQVYHSGDSVHVMATVTFPAEMHGYEIKVTDTVSGLVVYDEAQHVHNDHFEISSAYVSTGTQAMPGLKLELLAEIDHDGTTASKVVRYQYVP